MTNTENWDAIVIGSGLGGLTAGALYARTGARVLLLERNVYFGGAATTYRHGSMLVEASLHETTHPDAPGDPKSDVFAALDLGDDIEFLPIDNFHEIRCPLIGKPFVLTHGFDVIEENLIDRFPQHKKNIHKFLRQIRRSLEAVEFFGVAHDAAWRLAHTAELPLDLWAVVRDMRSSLSDVLTRYFGEDEAIKFALAANLPYYSDDPDEFWWFGYAMAQGGYMRGGGYYIKGGSQTLSDRLAAIIRAEGGETLSQCEAFAIELGTEGDILGVRYRQKENGMEIIDRAPVVFANAAPHVIETMLPAEQRVAFMKPFADRRLSISLFSATLGLNEKPSKFGVSNYSTQLIPAWMTRLSDFKHATGLMSKMPGERMPALGMVDYSRIDSGLAIKGVFPVGIVCADRLENWANLSGEAYKQRKNAWLEAIIQRLDKEWPGIGDAVVDTSVATAVTMHEYLNTPGGAVYGFAMRPPKTLPKGPPMTLATSIKGLWLASSYAGFGGFTGAMGSGAAAARAALAKEKEERAVY